MNMKKLIESMDRIEECGMTEMPTMAPPMQQGTPVSMNVSLNASGAEHVEDLIKMMKNAGMGAAEPVSAKMLSPRMDMERLSSIMGEPDMGPEMEELEDEIGEEEGPCPECGMEPCECDHAEEAYANEPEPEYGDMSDAIPNGNDLNRKKGAYKVVAGGDNPMEYTMEVESIKAALLKALTEKKAKPDFLDMDKDGDKKEPMKKAIADKGSKPKKGQVPPQFQKKTDEGIISTVKKAYQDAKKEKEKNAYHNKLAGDALKRMEPKELKPYYDAMRDKKKKK